LVEEFDAIVVGLGGIGSAAAYWLARRGARILGLERFELGHERGASQDHSRIIRRSYHTPGYVRMADAAYEAWAALEAEAGEALIVRTGGLDLWPAGAAIPIEDYTSSLAANSVPFEVLDAGEVMRRWPQWRLADDTVGMFQEDGGIAPAARCNAAHRRMAVEHGATLIDRSPVETMSADGGELEVEAGGARYRCGHVVLAADAWTNQLLEPLGWTLPLTILREQVIYYGAPDPGRFAPERFPIWIWMDEPSFYGFPTFGEAGPKAAQDCGGHRTTIEERTFTPDVDEAARVDAFVRDHLPEAFGPPLAVKTCLYTLTPDRDFVLDGVPGHANILVTLGAAHGFKFASLFGRTVADLIVEGRTEVNLEPFRIDRPILRETDPSVSWMI
jgi:sarcosine oxidase